MKFDYAILADFAQVVENKLYIQGGAFTRVNAGALPWTFQLAIAMRLEPEADDDLSRDWQLGLVVAGPHGETVAAHFTPINLNVPEQDMAEGEPRAALLALTINGLTIHTAGPHTVSIALNDVRTMLTFAVPTPPAI